MNNADSQVLSILLRRSPFPAQLLLFERGMTEKDFFTFCSSLQLSELRVISKFSEVKHFSQGDLVYSAGDVGEELYIVNRGIVEITPDPPYPGMMTTMLSRGDIFGETGAFLELPRAGTAHARAPLSLQCFRGANFPELLKLVPSFFLFLSQKLARQLFQAREIGRSQNGPRELMGSLANFDLVTIYQTIVRSMQSGLLIIADEHGVTLCEFAFDKGVPRWGRFRQLDGEEAFWQLFIEAHQGWSFSFSEKATASAEWTEKSAIHHSADELLLQAVHMRDEFEDLCKRMTDPSLTLKRKQLNFAWLVTDHDHLRPLAETIWQIAYSKPVSLGKLCQRCGVCSLKIYRVVEEMVNAGLFDLVSNGKAAGDEGHAEKDEPLILESKLPT